MTLLLGLRVEGFMGSLSPSGGLKVTDIAVATIEKANSIVNHIIISIVGQRVTTETYYNTTCDILC